VDALRYLAFAYQQQEELEDAIIQYRKALAWDPTDLESKIGIAAIFSQQGDNESAIREYEKILTHKAEFHKRFMYASACLTLGDLYAVSGNIKRAREVWSKIHEKFSEQIYLREISRYLVGKITESELLTIAGSWHPELKKTVINQIMIKRQTEGILK